MVNSTLFPTIFHEDWWLEAATNGNYGVAEVLHGDSVVGRLPYCLTRRFGMRWCTPPELTYFLGPAIDEGTGNIYTRIKRRFEITRDLIRKLPAASFTQFKCHRGVSDVIPFQDEGFRTTVQFTYEIAPASHDELWGNIYHKKRRVILRALEAMDISRFDDPSRFIQFYQTNLDEKAIKNRMDIPACSRIIEACIARNRGCILAAFDQNKNLAAAIFYVWDDSVSYYVMTTRTLASGSGIISALVWLAIKDAAGRQLTFDLGGLNAANGVPFYAAFGGNPSQRYVATRATLPVSLVREVRAFFDKDKNFMS
jgi:Acetyltransferase (GNAT) domain